MHGNQSVAWVRISALLFVLMTACRSQEASTPSTRSDSGDPIVASGNPILAAEKQEHIWDVEHAAFELEHKFGRAFGVAIRERNSETILSFCRPGFTATLPHAQRRQTDDLGFVHQQRTDLTEGEGTTADSKEFAAHLFAYFEPLAEIEKISFRVLDLQSQATDADVGRWDATLYIAAVGRDANEEHVELVSQHRAQLSFADDSGVEEGTILDTWAVRSEVIRRAPGPLFKEATESYGLAKLDIHDNWAGPKEHVRQYHTQLAIEDFNRDGYHDLAVCSSNGRWRLLISIGGESFEEVTDQVGLPSWSSEEPRSRAIRDEAYLATWIDFNNDHFPDLLLGDRLYENQEGVRFRDVTDASGLVFGYNPRGCVVADYDCDGRLDLYVLYQHPRTREPDAPVGWVGDDGTGRENHLWRNAGNGSFVNVSEQANAGGGKRQSFAATWLHANEDHYPDLYVANDFGTNSLLMNQGNGRFLDQSSELAVADYATSMGVAAGDMTGDGRPEIYVANMFSKMGRRIIAHVEPDDYPEGIFEQIQGACAGNRLYTLADDAKHYQEISEITGVNTVGWAYAPALADFDGDGQLDIYATTGFLSFRRDKPDG